MSKYLVRDVMATSKKKPLNAQDRARQVRLRAAWDTASRRGDANAKQLAMSWGVHPSNVSQYLNAHIPLNVEAQLQFARHLRVSPVDIWPDFEFADLIGDPAESLSLLSEDDRQTGRH